MKKLPVFVILFFLLIAFPHKILAASTLYFSPSSGNLKNGQNLSVEIKVNSGQENINAITASFVYPANQLTLDSITVNESVLPIVAEKTVGTGTIKISGANYTPFSGDQLLATVNYIVNSDSSAAAFIFTQDSAVVRANDNQNDLKAKLSANFSSLPTTHIVTESNLTSLPAVKSEKTVSVVEALKVFFWRLLGLNV